MRQDSSPFVGLRRCIVRGCQSFRLGEASVNSTGLVPVECRCRDARCRRRAADRQRGRGLRERLPAGAGPLRPVLRIDDLAAKAVAELLGVMWSAKQTTKCRRRRDGTNAARAKREALAKEVDRHVVVAQHRVGAKRHLVRPLPVDGSFAQFAFAIDHGTTSWSPPALDATCQGDGGCVRGACGRRQRGVSKTEQKGNIFRSGCGERHADMLDEARALERQVEREWWWLNGALHAVAQVQADRLQGALVNFREMQAQAREVDRRRVRLRSASQNWKPTA